MQLETFALIVFLVKVDSATFSKVGLMNLHLWLQSLDPEWLLLSRNLNPRVFKATRNGWYAN